MSISDNIKTRATQLFIKVKGYTKHWLDSSSNTSALSNLLIAAIILIFIVVSTALLFLTITFIYNVFATVPKSPFDTLGPFGDFIGGFLNPILTFLMFMGVLVTIVIQSKELKETRKEIKAQADSNKEHVKVLKNGESRKQLMDAFNEARNRFWTLSKESMRGSESIYDTVLFGFDLPKEKHYAMQFKYINRKLDTLTNLSVQLLPKLSEPVQNSIICEIEDIFTFAIEAKILTEDDTQIHLDKFKDAISESNKVGRGIINSVIDKFWNSLKNDLDGHK